MELMSTKTYSQGSDLWNPQPISLNFPVAAIVATEEHIAVGSSQVIKPISNPVRGVSKTRSQKPEKPKADIIADRIHAVVEQAGNTPEEPRPSNAVMAKAIHLIGSVKDCLLGDPDVDTSFGQIHLTWHKGVKQVVLMSVPDRDPMIHHHHRIKGAASRHSIEKASTKRLAHWLRWLHE
jgi:hypothetical protein